ncbi:EAL domain-containing protein [Persephonella sp. KM09-Lau-8]|uniref:EAL domain-containing protein n=1 Tax=Persephonella sp. KM09-Lau-8 TaxID=1158345 RepID=UPI00068F726C|nr:EAL domain-containing protein [Persephonella sp. KM09-Lau-8]
MESNLEHKILENSPDIIFVIKPDKEIIYINKTFCEVLEFSPEEILGKPADKIIDSQHIDSLIHSIENNFPIEDQEAYLISNSGKRIRVIIRAGAVKNGKVQQIIINARDLTYLNILKEQLEKYAETLEEIVQERTKELTKTKNFLENVLSSIPDIFLVLDENGNVVLSNDAAKEKLKNIPNITEKIFVKVDSKEIPLKQLLSEIIDNKRTCKSFTSKLVLDEREIPMHLVASSLSKNTDIKGIVLVLKDVSELKEKENFLNLYKTIYENTLDAIGIVDTEGRYVDQNKSNEELLGYSIEEIRGKRFPDFLKIPNAEETLEQLKKKGRLRFISTTIDRHGNKKYLDIVALAVKDKEGNDKYYVGIKRDITDIIQREKELEELNKKLEKRLYTDPLTGLPNRLKLIEDLKNIASPKLAILNIDDFKEINDFYGYQVGDYILKQLGVEIKEFLTDSSYRLYKLSADEYAVLAIRYIQTHEFERVINQLIYHIQETPIIYEDNEIHVSITAGISLENHNILNKADMALKYAKANKKPIVYYKDELQMKELYEKNILITNKIKDALKTDRVLVHYQPIFETKTGNIDKFEALVRVVDFDGKLLTPKEFLDIAKKAKLYPEITKKVLQKTFENFRDVDKGFSINISVEDIHNREITKMIFDYLSQEDFKNRVVFEILESEGIKSYTEVSEFFKEIKKLGGRIAIDDFGSGYSNFEYILKLDVDFIKIDGSLIKNIDKDLYSQVIVETIINFAKKLGIRTVAEYVHSEEVYEMAKNLEIDYCQGYYLSPPKPFEELFKRG